MLQNVDPFFFGDEAALASGAVVASGRDSGSLWYNPAGFGGLDRGLVSGSASTFGVRFRTVPDALRLRVGGQERTVALSSTDVLSVPNAVVIAARVTDRVALAAGLLTTDRDVRSASAKLPEAPATDAMGRAANAEEHVDLQVDRATYHAGVAVGVIASSRLRVGGALFGVYVKETDGVQVAFNLRRGPNVTDEHAFVTQSARLTGSGVAVAGSLGAQYDVSRFVTIGLTLRLPSVALTASTEGNVSVGAASAGGATPTAQLVTVAAPPVDATGSVVAPGRALFGVAYALGPPQSFVEVGAEVAHGLPNNAFTNPLVPTVNARVGFRYLLSPSWVVGAGLFSDRAPERDVGKLVGSYRVDWYGLTAGVSKRTPLALARDPSPEALVLVTTFSLRTSIGFGEARGATIDLDQPSTVIDTRSNVTFFELMPYLGSSVVF